MKATVKFKLVRPAKKAGGDRYENENNSFVIYIPQEISRLKTGQPAETIKAEFTME